MKHYFILIFVVILCFIAIGCGAKNEPNNNKEPSAGNKLYIHDGYQEQLTKMGLKELQPFPYFSKPFITVAKDDQGAQFAVIYRVNNKVDLVKLPVNLEQIKQILENKGIDLSGPDGANLHLFEINQKLYWAFENGNARIKLDFSGHEIKE